MGIRKDQISEVKGQVAAEDKDIIKSNYVLKPIDKLQQLGPKSVMKIPIQPGSIVAGDPTQVRLINGDPVKIAQAN